MLVSKITLSLSKRFARLAMFVYSATVLLASVLRVNASGALNRTTLVGFRADYLLHILLFAPFMPLARWGWSRVQQGNAWFWPACGAGLVLAAFSECLQWFLSYRTFNPLDLAANVGGIILGALIARMGGGTK